MILRNMLRSDLRHVNLILSKAFTHAGLQTGAEATRVPLCREPFLQMYLAANPEATFVAEKKGKIVGFCFSRLWGRVAWIGPLGVRPADQNQGYGKQIVSASVDVLKQQGAYTIGLEMPASSPKNIGFYSKLGFALEMPTVDLMRKVAPDNDSDQEDIELIRHSEPDGTRAENFLQEAAKFSKKIEPGLVYTKEIQLASEFRFGEGALLSRSGQTIGFLLAHTEAYSQEEARRFLKINVLQMAPELPISTLGVFINKAEDWARGANLAGVYVRVPARYSEALQFFFQSGFVAINTELRLTLKGFSQKDDPGVVNISKWE